MTGSAAPGREACLATVTTEAFMPGTLVTVGSFLKHHPDFGDVVIIQDGLSGEHREALSALSRRVRFAPVSSELRERLARVGAAVPRFAPILSHLHAFEAYRLSGYRKVLLVDGDLVFRQPIGELFETGDALVCCGDGVYLAGRRRDAATFLPLDDPGHAGPGVLDRTFNDGFLLIDAGLTGESVYADLLSMVTPETWRGTGTPHFKQFLHNRYFAGRQTLVSSTYNFLLGSAASIRVREDLAIEDAKVLHFNVPHKPWKAAEMLRRAYRDAPEPAFGLWYEAWLDCLATVHLRTAHYSRAVSTCGTSPHDYTAYGLHVRSPIALPFTRRPGSRRDAPDVLIRFGETPAALPAPVQRDGDVGKVIVREMAPGAFLLTMAGHARYLVTDGRNIVIDPLGGDERDMEAALTKPLMTALLRQRGVATFHAGAVAAEAGAVLFLGDSGSGKSSLAGAFVARGCDLLTDELTGVVLGTDGRLEVLPGFPRIKLRQDVLDVLGWRAQGRLRPEAPKHVVPVERLRATPLAPCAAFILMVGDGTDTEIERVPPIRVLRWLKIHTPNRKIVQALGQYRSYFHIVAALAKSIPFFLVTRPAHPLRLDVLADRIEEALADAAGCIPPTGAGRIELFRDVGRPRPRPVETASREYRVAADFQRQATTSSRTY